MKIHKNILDKEKFKEIQNILTSTEFPWYLNYVVNFGLNKKVKFNHQMCHIMYIDNVVNSNFYHIIKPVYEKIKWFSLLKVKANLIMRSEKIIEHSMHTDFPKKPYKTYTGILYINTNNGYTKFDNGKIINTEENKYVEFDSQLKHTGSSCTDEEYRIVINFNYIK
jgi:hypothetical protein